MTILYSVFESYQINLQCVWSQSQHCISCPIMFSYHASALCLLHACNSATVGAILTIRFYGSIALTSLTLSLSLVCKSSFESKIVHFEHVTLSFSSDITGDWLHPGRNSTFNTTFWHQLQCLPVNHKSCLIISASSCLPSSLFSTK